jgi:hypothetical protein
MELDDSDGSNLDSRSPEMTWAPESSWQNAKDKPSQSCRPRPRDGGGGCKAVILHGITVADSVILATAQRHSATLWSQNADFDGLPGIRYFARQHRE